MLQVKYQENFDKKEYYTKIAKKYFYIKLKDKNGTKQVREEFKGINFGNKKILTLKEIFTKYKKVKKDDFDVIFKGVDFEDLLIGNFEKLEQIKNKIGTIKANKSIDFLFNYTDLRKEYISPFFENNLDIDTCYYCNIDYINSYNADKKKKNKFTLDHYYDKASYPYLALSLYNFVPSCYACNSKLKKTEEFSNLSPSSQKFDFDETVKFKLFLSAECEDLHIKSKDDIEIPLKESYSTKYEKYIEVFYLNERYKAHKNIVYEMMKNAELYPESRLKELEDLTGVPFKQIRKDIFNLVDEDTELSKKPFSKLIKDISEELGLV